MEKRTHKQGSKKLIRAVLSSSLSLKKTKSTKTRQVRKPSSTIAIPIKKRRGSLNVPSSSMKKCTPHRGSKVSTIRTKSKRVLKKSSITTTTTKKVPRLVRKRSYHDLDLPPEDGRSNFVYILHTRDTSKQSKFYTGFTVNLKRRIRQHNREIKGGARYTSMYKNWDFFCFISGFNGPKHRKTALQCEWILKSCRFYPSRRGSSSSKKRPSISPLMERIYRIHKILHERERFTQQSVPIKSLRLVVHWRSRLCLKKALSLKWSSRVKHVLISPSSSTVSSGLRRKMEPPRPLITKPLKKILIIIDDDEE